MELKPATTQSQANAFDHLAKVVETHIAQNSCLYWISKNGARLDTHADTYFIAAVSPIWDYECNSRSDSTDQLV